MNSTRTTPRWHQRVVLLCYDENNMPRSPEITGSRTPEERREAEKLLDRARERARIPARGEAEKTPEDLRAIETMNAVIRRALSELGIEASVITPAQIHLLDPDAFAAVGGKPAWEWSGFANVNEDAMYVKTEHALVWAEHQIFIERLEAERRRRDDSAIDEATYDALDELGLTEIPAKDTEAYARYDATVNRILDRKDAELDAWAERQEAQYDANARYQVFATMVHEALHLQAFRRFSIERTIGNADEEQTLTHRSGYRYYHAAGDDYFVSLNEAITQELTDEAIQQSRDLLDAAAIPFPEALTEEDDWDRKEREQQRERGYVEDRTLLRFLMERIAERNGETVEVVWGRFSESYLTGSMMHLRDIERTFGKGALRFYASIMPKDLADHQRRELAFTYFNATDDDARAAARTEFRNLQIKEEEVEERGRAEDREEETERDEDDDEE